MKIVGALMIFAITFTSPSKNHNTQPMPNKNDCFSATNFNLVYQYISESMQQDSSAYYRYEKYQLHPGCAAEIAVKQDGYTLAIISRERGIYSLAKVLSDNNRLVSIANEMFCNILSQVK